MNTISNGLYGISGAGSRKEGLLGKRMRRFICKDCNLNFRESDQREYPSFLRAYFKFALGREYSYNGLTIGVVGTKMLSKHTGIPISVLKSWDESPEHYDNKIKDFKYIYESGADIVAVFKTFEIIIRPPKK